MSSGAEGRRRGRTIDSLTCRNAPWPSTGGPGRPPSTPAVVAVDSGLPDQRDVRKLSALDQGGGGDGELTFEEPGVGKPEHANRDELHKGGLQQSELSVVRQSEWRREHTIWTVSSI